MRWGLRAETEEDRLGLPWMIKHLPFDLLMRQSERHPTLRSLIVSYMPSTMITAVAMGKMLDFRTKKIGFSEILSRRNRGGRGKQIEPYFLRGVGLAWSPSSDQSPRS